MADGGNENAAILQAAVDTISGGSHNDEFYLRLYIGHTSKAYGHEFMVRVFLCCVVVYQGCIGWYESSNDTTDDPYFNSSLRLATFQSAIQEFEVCPSGKLRYANNSNYKDDSIIRREVMLGPAVVQELKRIIRTSEISTVDDEHWYSNNNHHHHDTTLSSSSSKSTSNPNHNNSESSHYHHRHSHHHTHHHTGEQRQQELEIKIGNEHIAFTCAEIMSLADIQDSRDPQGMTTLYYLTQDLKCFVMSLINLHFKIKPIPSW